MSSRKCGSCTKCCEGWLVGEAYGYKFFPQNPCFFLEINNGCIIYDTRPDDPCKSFNCLWIKNEQTPVWMYPKTNKCIPIESNIAGIPYINLVPSDEDINDETINWWIEWCKTNNKNLFWIKNKQKNAIGSDEFLQAINSY